MGSGCGPSRAFFAPGQARRGKRREADVRRRRRKRRPGRACRHARARPHRRAHAGRRLHLELPRLQRLRVRRLRAACLRRKRSASSPVRTGARGAAPRARRPASPSGAWRPYRFSTQGRPVTLRPDATRLFNGYDVDARLLATEAGRAFYRLRRPPTSSATRPARPPSWARSARWAAPAGPAAQPLVEFGAFSQKPGEQPRADRLEGFAADEVATVVAVDEHGNRLAEATTARQRLRVPPRAREMHERSSRSTRTVTHSPRGTYLE